MSADFGLGSQGRFDDDLEHGTLSFTGPAGRTVVAEVQVAGTTSDKAGDWLWAWANPHLPPGMVTDSARVRAFGQEHGIAELTDEAVAGRNLNGTGWMMAAIAVRIAEAEGAYRPPSGGGALYLILKGIARAG